MYRNSGDKALIIYEDLTQDDYTLRGDFIFADILAMVAPAHLDNDHDLAQLTVDAYVPKPDNVIGKKGNRVGAEHSVKDSFTSTVLRIVTPIPVKAVIIR
jgi:hypothetical protein